MRRFRVVLTWILFVALVVCLGIFVRTFILWKPGRIHLLKAIRGEPMTCVDLPDEEWRRYEKCNPELRRQPSGLEEEEMPSPPGRGEDGPV